MRRRLEQLVRRGDREVLATGLGLAPLVAATGSGVTTLVVLAVFAAAFASAAAVLAWLRYQVTARERLFWVTTVTAFAVAICDQLLAAIAYPVRQQAGMYIGVIAMNCLLVDRLEHIVSDRYLPPEIPLTRFRLATARRVVTTLVTVAGIVTAVFLARHAASETGGRVLAGLKITAPGDLVFFETPGGALICLGLVLALARHLGDLHDDGD